MLIRNLPGLLMLFSLTAHALQTEDLSDATLLKLATTLDKVAGSSQWQQLWSRTRNAGHLEAHPTLPYFTAPTREIPALVSTTLNQAQSASPLKQTQALYRRDFSPMTVGRQGTNELTAICIWVDWRTLPEKTRLDERASMQQVSLLLTRPCQ